MKKIILSIFTLLAVNSGVNAQNVNIPDANFKMALLSSLVNTNLDFEIQITEAQNFNGTLFLSSQNISNLTGIEYFTSLIGLYIETNQLTTIDLASNTMLEILRCGGNPITTLNLSNNINLMQLRSNGCPQLTSLDISMNTNLTYLWTYNCPLLSSLNVSNGNNSNFTNFKAANNPNLTCIQVDNVAYSTTNWTNIDAGASFSLNCPPPCTVTIPDANFKSYLVGNALINTNGNTEIECSEASAFTGIINCSNQSISDLTGIEAFTALTYLWCYNNQLTTLDISINTALISLRCGTNQLTSLDVTNSTVLTELLCHANQLINLDVSNNTTLMTLWCNNNQLGSLNVSNNTSLTDLRCYTNQLTILDVSQNNSLTLLRAESNQLTSLNVVNGNNTNFSVFNASNNSNLTCIQVDNVTYSTTNWTNIDAIASFSTNCIVLVNSITVQGQGSATTITTAGGTLQIEGTVLPANAANGTYTWSVTNQTGSATIDANGLLTASTDGTIIVTATANDASGESDWMIVTISNQSVGVNELTLNKVSVYPNPVQNELFIELDNQDITEVTIIDVTGKTVKVIEGNSTIINVSDLTQGIYFLRVQTEQGLINSKFIKE